MFDTVIRGGRIVDGTGALPFSGDIGIRDDRIAAVGTIEDDARVVIDADGAVVTPGFFDLHTHYDGQVTWDDALEPSATNGITTIVLGNCGVGFAPVRPEDHESLIDMMEGVEDIPGGALSVGMPWGRWESFGEYLDLIASRQYATNVACHIAHGPLRYYVMGERAYEDRDATPNEVAEMARLVREAFAAGAAGFSTNRFRAHMSRSGKIVPGTFAPVDELTTIARAVGGAGPPTASWPIDRSRPGPPRCADPRCASASFPNQMRSAVASVRSWRSCWVTASVACSRWPRPSTTSPTRPRRSRRRRRRSARSRSTTSTTCWSKATARPSMPCSARTSVRAPSSHAARCCSMSTRSADCPTHWVRDRHKGARVPLELAVHKLTGAPAAMYGLTDRGVIAAGNKADLNVIDFDNLVIQAPRTRDDLPTGASRILQPSTGYLATMVNGHVVRRDDEDTGDRSGHLLRSGTAAAR